MLASKQGEGKRHTMPLINQLAEHRACQTPPPFRAEQLLSATSFLLSRILFLSFFTADDEYGS
jgi:hypothetical protein